MKNLRGKKLMYRWTGCACSIGREKEVTPGWDDLQPIYGWDGNLAVVGCYSLRKVRRELLSGKKEVRIGNICPNCFGAGDDVYYFKPED
jgi:hypothetical protein